MERRWLPFLLSLGVLTACGRVSQLGESVELLQALRKEYPGGQVNVGWVNGLSHLEVRLDAPSLRSIPDSEVEGVAESIARIAAGHFPRTREPDSITVELVEDQSGQVIKTTVFRSRTFATAAFR